MNIYLVNLVVPLSYALSGRLRAIGYQPIPVTSWVEDNKSFPLRVGVQ